MPEACLLLLSLRYPLIKPEDLIGIVTLEEEEVSDREPILICTEPMTVEIGGVVIKVGAMKIHLS